MHPEGRSISFHEITGRKLAEEASREGAQLLAGQNHVLELIARGAPLHDSLDALLRVIEAQCVGTLCSILVLDPDGVHIRHGAAPSLPESFTRAVDGQPIGPYAGSCGTAAFRREPVVVEDIATDPLWDSYRAIALPHGLRACWSTPIFDAERRVLGTFALYSRSPGRPGGRHRQLIDISTHIAAIALVKHAETEALRASEERLRLAISGGNVGIWEWDVETGRVICSDQMKTILGWPSDTASLTLAMFLDAIHDEDRHRIDRTLRSALDTRADFDAECRVVRPDGSIRWVATKSRGDYDAGGRPVRMMGVVLDINDRKEAEEEINRRETQLAEAQKIAHLGSYEWDVRTGVVFRSEELYAIFGLTHDQFAPTFEGYLERVHPDDRSTTEGTIRAAFNSCTPFDFEERIVRPAGVIRRLRSQGKWICDATGQPSKLVGICQDVTERKQAEDEITRRRIVAESLKARNEELKAFAYTVSHDLKAPLRGIVGYAQELERHHRAGLDERALWCLDRILIATRNLDRLIEDLLRYSHIEAETPIDADVNLMRLVDSILRDRQPVIMEHCAVVTLRLEARSIHTWERGLRQVLTNLIDNAIKYSRNACPPRIEIASHERDDRVQISVSDNGIGFDLKYHDRIFGLFNRLVRQEEFEGTGAGLAIVKKVVEKLHGCVWAQSQPGSGATFLVELPAGATAATRSGT
jgi:PAS domain S-box-containing protein